MRRIVLSAFALGVAAACQGPAPAIIGGSDRYEVHGVEEGDMLKLRAGPGTGFDVRFGMPNGTVVRARDCERMGGTRWCKVSPESEPTVVGYASESYLRKL